MARRSLATFDTLWARHESLYVEVFSLALHELSTQHLVSGNEDAVSESLCPALTAVCFSMGRRRDCDIPVPSWEKPRQPVSREELTGGKKRKRPDFSCSCYNRYATNPKELEVPFHIECKLLGEPTSPSWVLCRNYVTKGIARFDNWDHQYGKRAPSGAMIGYMISLTPDGIQAQVNENKGKHLEYIPDIIFEWGDTHVHHAVQIITRRCVPPANFRLMHVWVDLRHNYRA